MDKKNRSPLFPFLLTFKLKMNEDFIDGASLKHLTF